MVWNNLRTETHRLERPEIASIDDGLAWLHDQVWPIETDHERRQTVKRMLSLRWQHADEWRQRGGADDGR